MNKIILLGLMVMTLCGLSGCETMVDNYVYQRSVPRYYSQDYAPYSGQGYGPGYGANYGQNFRLNFRFNFGSNRHGNYRNRR